MAKGRYARPPIHGVGITDVEHRVATDPIYKVWVKMLQRCYSKKYQEKQPTYIGCSVCPEWHRYSAFREWVLRQPWQGRYLDKDLLHPGNTLYAPERCVFVDRLTNNLLHDHAAARGDHPLGVTFDKSRGLFSAKCNTIESRTANLGRFSNSLDAHAAWQREKAKVIRQVASLQTDERVALALEGRAKKLDDDRTLGLVTEDHKNA